MSDEISVADVLRAERQALGVEEDAACFTGFSNTDDIAMAALDPKQRPFHVVNLTLNLVAGTRLAWQQRKAASFTMTALHCGNADTGYRPSSAYAGRVSLGTAVALSGAAASPNMGYHYPHRYGYFDRVRQHRSRTIA